MYGQSNGDESNKGIISVIAHTYGSGKIKFFSDISGHARFVQIL